MDVFESLLVRDAMSTGIVSISPDAVVDAAVDLMVRKNVSGLPVVDDQGSLVGVITEYDVLQLYERMKSGYRLIEPCQGYMTRDVKTIRSDASLSTAAAIFRAASLRRLFVVDEGRLMGILSRRDVVRALRDLLGPTFLKESLPASVDAV